MGQSDTGSEQSTRQRVLGAARSLFARKGFDGASVRTICDEAEASSNAVTYHFGSKQELFAEIVEDWASQQLDLAERMLSAHPSSAEEFRVRLGLFLQEALEALHRERDVVRIVFRGEEALRDVGGAAVKRIAAFSGRIARFVRAGMEVGAVAPDIDADVVAGLLHDRLVNQAAFAPAHEKVAGVSSRERTYRAHWVDANLRIVLHGILASSETKQASQ